MRPASLVRERGLQLLEADFAVPVSEKFQSKFHLKYKSVQANDLRRALGKADAVEKLDFRTTVLISGGQRKL